MKVSSAPVCEVKFIIPKAKNSSISKLHNQNTVQKTYSNVIRMWANAQRDGRPAEYRWRPLFNAAVWQTPTTRVPCRNAAKTRNPLKFAGVPQTKETISAARRPKFATL